MSQTASQPHEVEYDERLKALVLVPLWLLVAWGRLPHRPQPGRNPRSARGEGASRSPSPASSSTPTLTPGRFPEHDEILSKL